MILSKPGFAPYIRAEEKISYSPDRLVGKALQGEKKKKTKLDHKKGVFLMASREDEKKGWGTEEKGIEKRDVVEMAQKRRRKPRGANHGALDHRALISQLHHLQKRAEKTEETKKDVLQEEKSSRSPAWVPKKGENDSTSRKILKNTKSGTRLQKRKTGFLITARLGNDHRGLSGRFRLSGLRTKKGRIREGREKEVFLRSCS